MQRAHNLRWTSNGGLRITSGPPYQTVVYFPHSGAQSFHALEDTQLAMFDFLVKSGRAVMVPIYKGTYERLGTPPEAWNIRERDEVIQQADDLRRSVDYLETRNDIAPPLVGVMKDTLNWLDQYLGPVK